MPRPPLARQHPFFVMLGCAICDPRRAAAGLFRAGVPRDAAGPFHPGTAMLITSIEITHHRLDFDAAVPRELGLQAAAPLGRDHRAGAYGCRAHRHRLGRPDAGVCRARTPVRRPRPAGDRAALPHAQPHQFPLRALLAARPGAVGPRGQDHRPAVLEAARRAVGPGARLCVVRHAARPGRDGGGGRTLSGRGFPRR